MTMAYRRRQGMSRSSTFTDESIHGQALLDPHHEKATDGDVGVGVPSNVSRLLSPSYSFNPTSSSSSSSSLAAQAIKASAARRDPSLSFALGQAEENKQHHRSKSSDYYGDGSKSSFWGVINEKVKEILDDGNTSPKQDYDYLTSQKLRSHSFNTFTPGARTQEASRILGENKPTLGISSSNSPSQDSNQAATTTKNPPQSIRENKLKATRDVAMATAAKAKLLLRELKTVKADLAFANARSAQLEEENKLLRDNEGREKGQNRADDDLIRLQLETLLAEKARLASENEVYSRENHFLREIVEYHQLTGSMQDHHGVYLDDDDDEGMDEIAAEQLYPHPPIITDAHTRMHPSPVSSSLAARPMQQQQSKSLLSQPPQQQQDNNNITPQDHEAPPSRSQSASISDDDQHAK